jgi:hypothetical protein
VGIARNQYKINPGLYCVGKASATSPVLVTANYKLSFDALRRELAGIDAWILVADTRGINIWCAAGKGTFCTEEIALQVQRAGLEKIVSHRELILPQFGATGVAARQLRKLCGFKGIFGPLRAEDIPGFLDHGKKADEPMRSVTFSLGERLVLVPVEIAIIWKPFALVLLALFVLSGIGPDVFSVQASLTRGANAAWATVLAILAGALAAPALLPWIPGRQFWFKGSVVGAITGLIYLAPMSGGAGITEQLGLWLWIVAAASFMAMNFTGATPYTSLSGVEKEMRRGLPVQCVGAAAALALWIAAPFIN